MYLYSRKNKKLKSFSEFQNLLDYYSDLPAIEQNDHYYWSFGCTHWVLANEVLTAEVLKNKNFKIPDFPIALLEKSEHADKTDLIQEKSAVSHEARRFRRFAVRLKVIISNKQKTFLSYSKNISEGGVLLEDQIPKTMFNQESEIYISSPNKKEIIAFKCTPIGDEENPNRLRFEDSQTHHLEKLRSWIEAEPEK